MKKLSAIMILVIIGLFLGCDNSVDGSDNSDNESETLTSVIKNPADFTGLKIINNTNVNITLHLGTKSSGVEDILVETNELAPGVSQVIIPTDNTPVNVWITAASNGEYLLVNDNRVDEKYLFKSTGSYQIDLQTVNSYYFDFYYEPGSSTSNTVDNSSNPIVITPEIFTVNPLFSTNDLEVISGNLYKSDASSTFAYGIFDVKNNGTNQHKFVKVYYNYLDSQGNKAFDDDILVYINGRNAELDSDIVTNTCIDSNGTATIFIIDNIADGNFDIDDITGMWFHIETGKPVTLPVESTNFVLSYTKQNTDITWNITNNLSSNVMFDGYSNWKNTDGYYLHRGNEFKIIGSNTSCTVIDSEPNYRSNLTASLVYYSWSRTSLAPTSLNRSISSNDEIDRLKIIKQITR